MQNSTMANQSSVNQANSSTQTNAAATQALQNQGQASASQLEGFQQVKQQVATLRQTLQDLMMNEQYVDGEIMTASAALDIQLEDYYRTLSDQREPSMRSF